MAKRLIKVRVYLKHPLGKYKSQTMQMTESQISWNRANKMSSPYSKIVRV